MQKNKNTPPKSGLTIRLEDLNFGEVVRVNGSIYQVLRQWDGDSVRAADKRDHRWRCRLRYDGEEVVVEGPPSSLA